MPNEEIAAENLRRRVRVPSGGVFSVDPKRPYLWGNNVWIVEGVESPEPPDEPDDPDRSFIAAIRLTRLGESVKLPETISGEALLDGDSNFLLASSTHPREFTIAAAQSSISVKATLVANKHGRLGGILVEVPAAKSPRTAYQAARTVFNGLQMQVAFDQDLSIREAAIAVWESTDKTFVMRGSVSYPDLPFDLTRKGPSLIMQRVLAPYADAINSNSPYYSFLVYFALLEFMLNSWIGAMRRAFETRRQEFSKRSYVVQFDEIHDLAPWYHEKSYQEVMTSMRTLRNAAGGPHFTFAIGPRVLTVRADDEIACARDVLRLIVKGMLEDARKDIATLLDAGEDEEKLAAELQTFFDKHDGHKKAKAETKRRK